MRFSRRASAYSVTPHNDDDFEDLLRRSAESEKHRRDLQEELNEMQARHIKDINNRIAHG